MTTGELTATNAASAHVRRLSDGRRTGGSLSALAVAAAADVAELRGVDLPEALRKPAASGDTVAASVLADQREWLAKAGESDRSSYVEALAREGSLVWNTGESLSGASLIRVAEIATRSYRWPQDRELVIGDFATGVGSMLAGAARAVGTGQVRLIGQEQNRDVAMLASANLFAQGWYADVRAADSLTEDFFPDAALDLAVVQAPIGLTWHRAEERVRSRHDEDGWFPWGLPSLSDGSWLFTTRMLQKLRPADEGGGRLICFMSSSALEGANSEGVRRAVLEADLLDTVVALPNGLSPNTDLALFAVICSTSKTERRKGRVQLVDLRGQFQRSTRASGTARTLTGDADGILAAALASSKDGQHARSRATAFFLHRDVSVAIAEPEASQASSWPVKIPSSEQADKWLAERYGAGAVSYTDRGTVRSRIDFRSVFTGERQAQLKGYTARGWEWTRLTGLLIAPFHLVQKDVVPQGVTDAVALPVLPSLPAQQASTDQALDGRYLVLLLHPRADTAFVVAWLNSEEGRATRRRAYESASSGSVINALRTNQGSLMQFLDEVVVPLPPLAVQEAFASADSRLSAAAAVVGLARDSMWRPKSDVAALVRQFDPLFDESFGAWAASLPYPVATALRTFESRQSVLAEAHTQIFLVWEAYAAFFGIVLLSALQQDPTLREEEIPKLRSALDKAHLTATRATLGSWSVIVQRLSSLFRRLIDDADVDERARVRRLFGDAPEASLRRLLDAGVVNLLTEANAKRNSWTGHAGTQPPHELREHVEHLTGLLGELRGIVADAWRDLPLVRAGTGRSRNGQLMQQVELVMGPTSPFQQEEIPVRQLLDEGELYLTAQGASSPLPVLRLLTLRGAPEGARYACYYFNRIEGQRVRVVSYHLTDSSEHFDDSADIRGALDGLL